MWYYAQCGNQHVYDRDSGITACSMSQNNPARSESTRLKTETKDELYRLSDRRQSYDDVVRELLALRQSVISNPNVDLSTAGDEINVRGETE